MKANQPNTRKRAAARAAEAARGHATAAAILGPAFGPASTCKPGHVPPKWAKHYRRLLALRAQIEAERSGHAQIASQPLEPYSMDMADAATDEFDRNMALCKLSAGQDALYEIDAALKRIELGTYGVCEISGKRIPQARLRALPWTRFAGEAERQLELAGSIPPLHLGELRSVTGTTTGKLGETEPGEEEPEPAPSDESLSPIIPPTETDRSTRGRRKVAQKSALARAVPGGRAKRQSHVRSHREARIRRK